MLHLPPPSCTILLLILLPSCTSSCTSLCTSYYTPMHLLRFLLPAQVGPLAIWSRMLPCGMGVGVAMVILSMIVAIYYNVIMAYCLHYLFNSMRAELPWSSCSPSWGADSRCYERGRNTSAQDLVWLINEKNQDE